MASSKGIGIPIKLMHESEGHVLTVGTTYLVMLWRLLCRCLRNIFSVAAIGTSFGPACCRSS